MTQSKQAVTSPLPSRARTVMRMTRPATQSPWCLALRPPAAHGSTSTSSPVTAALSPAFVRTAEAPRRPCPGRALSVACRNGLHAVAATLFRGGPPQGSTDRFAGTGGARRYRTPSRLRCRYLRAAAASAAALSPTIGLFRGGRSTVLSLAAPAIEACASATQATSSPLALSAACAIRDQ